MNHIGDSLSQSYSQEEESALCNAVLPYDNSQENLGLAQSITVQAILNSDTLREYFDNLQCVKSLYAAGNGETSRYFIFKGCDAVTGHKVVLKVTNPAFQNATNDEENLKWESAILEYLKNKKRCQQIVKSFNSTKIDLLRDDKAFRETVFYIATQNLDKDIKKAFFDAKDTSLENIANRLTIFISIIHAVQALHKNGICHRDIKPSNFMGKTENLKCVVKTIDFGSSLATEDIERKIKKYSPAVQTSKLYAAPELTNGFSNNSELARKADIYALGCMLFELLDKRLYFNAMKDANTEFFKAINYCTVDENDFGGDFAQRINKYNSLLSSYAANLNIPQFAENSVIPDYEKNKLQKIIESMCNFDYRKRIADEGLEDVKNTLRTVIRALKNAHLLQIRKQRKQIQKMHRKEKNNYRGAF